ncbi:MAG: hypothetical protein ACFFDI_20670 [Promethearchaeota archaeon]
MVRSGPGYDTLSGTIITIIGVLWVLFVRVNGQPFNPLVILIGIAFFFLPGLFLILRDSIHRRRNHIRADWGLIIRTWIRSKDTLVEKTKDGGIITSNSHQRRIQFESLLEDTIGSTSETLENIQLVPEQFEAYRLPTDSVILLKITTFQNKIIDKAKLLDFTEYEANLWSIQFFKQTKRFQSSAISPEAYLTFLNLYKNFLDKKITT